jgi:saccharopine dehydrogenase-like NADP-dependent oxidoreductase
MHVLVIGGAGAMGRHACRVIARFPDVDRLAVADLYADAAARVADNLGPPAVGVGLDLREAGRLQHALDGVDVVCNTAGPFFELGPVVLAAAIDAGCHYLDICDDWEPTLEMLALHDRAEEAGVTAIVGLGASPGISNLLAVVAARELDEAHRIVTGWNAEGTQVEGAHATRPNAALMHGLRQMTGTIRVVRDGRAVDERPLRREVVDYPGIGRRSAITFGHPEPLTLRRFFPGVRDSVSVAFGSRSVVALMRAAGWVVDRRVLRAERVAALAQRIESRLPEMPSTLLLRDGALPPVFAVASGERRGQDAAVGAALMGFPGTSMGSITGTPLAVGLRLVADGTVERRGVLAPEACIGPDAFFSELAEHCVGHPPADEMLVVTRTWDPDPAAIFTNAAAAARARDA